MTLYWLDCCQQVGKLLEQSRGAPCYKPLPYALPIPGMARVRCVCAGVFGIEDGAARLLMGAASLTTRDAHVPAHEDTMAAPSAIALFASANILYNLVSIHNPAACASPGTTPGCAQRSTTP